MPIHPRPQTTEADCRATFPTTTCLGVCPTGAYLASGSLTTTSCTGNAQSLQWRSAKPSCVTVPESKGGNRKWHVCPCPGAGRSGDNVPVFGRGCAISGLTCVTGCRTGYFGKTCQDCDVGFAKQNGQCVVVVCSAGLCGLIEGLPNTNRTKHKPNTTSMQEPHVTCMHVSGWGSAKKKKNVSGWGRGV